MKTIRIIQNDTYSCYACVAAMITGETIQEVFDFCGHDGSKYETDSTHPQKCSGFGNIEIMKYLIDRGYCLGTWSTFDDPENLYGIDEIHFKIKINKSKAIIVVKSNRLKDCNHVIYWDGENIYDPSPDAEDNPSFADYEVLSFIPVINLR